MKHKFISRLLRTAAHRTISFEGYDILIGKTAEDNDILSLQLAQPKDMWLHASEFPGSHVVIKNKGEEFPKEVIQKAAELAAHYSKGRAAGVIEVVFCEAEDVYKPDGAAVGEVEVRNCKRIKVQAKL